MAVFRNVRKIKNGSYVEESNTNKPTYDLEERDNWLKEQIDSYISNNTRTMLSGEICDSSCINDQIVYLDSTSGFWKQGLVSLSTVEHSTRINLNDCSFIQGIVKNIQVLPDYTDRKQADIYLYGLIEAVNINNLIEAGETIELMVPYYLSANEYGKITKNRPENAEIFVGKFKSLTQFIFTPNVTPAALGTLAHNHFWYSLNPSKFQEINPGEYLYPAEEIPYFPPMPYDSTVLRVNGVDYEYDSCYYIDNLGLNYINDEYPPVSSPSDAFVAKLFFTRIETNNNGLVYSIRPITSNVILKSSDSGLEATTGNLNLSVIPETELEEDDENPVAIKSLEVDSTTGKIKMSRGQVVVGLEQGSGISLLNNTGVYTISSTNSYGVDGFEITDITLDGAKQRVLDNGMSYIEFIQGLKNGIKCKFLLLTKPSKDIDIVAYYNGSISGTLNLFYNYKIIKLNEGITGVKAISYNNIAVYPEMKKAVIFKIPNAVLEKDSIISINIYRQASDSYSGNFNLMFLKYFDN